MKLIDYFPDADFNRTVIECLGEPRALKEALLSMAGKSYELIDMEKQEEKHPRIGTQICGTLHQNDLIDCASYFLRLVDFKENQILENSILALDDEAE